MEQHQVPKSRILIVHPIDPKKVDFGADVVPNLQKACENKNNYSCIVINVSPDNLDQFFSYMDDVLKRAPSTQFIVVLNQLDQPMLMRVLQKKNIFKVLKLFNLDSITQEILFAIDKYDKNQQNNVLMTLIDEQNYQLNLMSKKLEKAVKKRQSYLEKSKYNLEHTSKIYKLLMSALIAIHKSQSIAHMEQNLYQVLSKNLNLNWLRIFYLAQENYIDQFTQAQASLTIYKQPLYSNQEVVGWCLYSIDGNPFTDHIDFFDKIANALGLSLDKITKLNQLESLKNQWKSTFNSITQALALVDNGFNIIQANNQYLKDSKKTHKQIIGQSCFISYFNKDLASHFSPTKPSNYKYQQSLSQNDSKNFDILSQPVQADNHEENLILVMFRDVTEENKMESYLIQSSKMAELGTIGSSIAHELNNPLGGILSFLQLIKMDMPKDHQFFDDINEMENAALRSKDIVLNLLGFSRFQSGSPTEQFSISGCVENALKILELQTRSKGIIMETHFEDKGIKIDGNKNQFTQALVNIIQNSIDAISDKMADTPGDDSLIRIETHLKSPGLQITITDNGLGIPPQHQKKIFDPLFSTKQNSSGLGLTVSFQILAQHNGHLEIFSQLQAGTSAKIQLRLPSTN
jgi:two-component system, NtrC family, sensor kinase